MRSLTSLPALSMGSSNILCPPRSLPVEVWERCWKYCQSRRLRRLVLVCRLFRNICQPLLFYEQIFRAPYTADITSKNWTQFCTYIALALSRLKCVQNSWHAPSVRRFTFMGSFELDLSWKYPGAIEMSALNRQYISVDHQLPQALSLYRQFTVLTSSPSVN
ncbi:hypothetical protein C8R47DRAFT_564207 [Mycena vitilis]|nr:hypothetical protein C8R47DRAFT_564207 [Mycena vitilis]